MFGTTGHVLVLVGAVLLIGLVVLDTSRRRRRGKKAWMASHVLIMIAMILASVAQISALT